MVPLAALWIVASHLLVLGGAPAQAVLVGAGAAGMVLWFLAGTGLVMAVSGYRAALPRMVDDEISA